MRPKYAKNRQILPLQRQNGLQKGGEVGPTSPKIFFQEVWTICKRFVAITLRYPSLKKNPSHFSQKQRQKTLNLDLKRQNGLQAGHEVGPTSSKIFF